MTLTITPALDQSAYVPVSPIMAVNPDFVRDILVVDHFDPGWIEVTMWCYNGLKIQSEHITLADAESIAARIVAAAKCPSGWSEVWHAPIVRYASIDKAA